MGAFLVHHSPFLHRKDDAFLGPGEPYIVAFSHVSETEVRLKWNPPLDPPNGVILHYEIMYWKVRFSLPIRDSFLGRENI